MSETIFAQATPPGRSGIAVIRISGPGAAPGAAALGAVDAPLRTAVLRRLTDPRDGRPLDHALVLRFAAPRSFTGEDSVELHVHGGPAVCRSIADALGSLPGFRSAEPGEFTRRALLNGKLDLAQVEGLGDLLAAETSAQAKQALALMDGVLSTMAEQWRDRLARALALIEVSIDFSDEDLPAGMIDESIAILSEMSGRFRDELAGSTASERLRVGFEVALVGAPNVGKSTLLNTLAGREAAITSEFAGTTRDAIEVRMDLDGLPVTFVDLAGFRDALDPIEAIGIDRSRRRADAADLRVFLLESIEETASHGITMHRGDQQVLAKSDLRRPSESPAISGLTGAGIAELIDRIVLELRERVASSGVIGRDRHRTAVNRALTAVLAAEACLLRHTPAFELAAADLHDALYALDYLLGKVDVEAVLDIVFDSFCIGK